MATSLNWQGSAMTGLDWKRLSRIMLDRSVLMCRDGQNSI
jgi:hypothetical protein